MDYKVIRKIRRDNKITLDEAARKIKKISIGYLNRLEKGSQGQIKDRFLRMRVENFINRYLPEDAI